MVDTLQDYVIIPSEKTSRFFVQVCPMGNNYRALVGAVGIYRDRVYVVKYDY